MWGKPTVTDCALQSHTGQFLTTTLLLDSSLSSLNEALDAKASSQILKQCKSITLWPNNAWCLQAAEGKHAASVESLKAGWAAELKRQKETWAAAEKARRDIWLADKTKQVKELTIKVNRQLPSLDCCPLHLCLCLGRIA